MLKWNIKVNMYKHGRGKPKQCQSFHTSLLHKLMCMGYTSENVYMASIIHIHWYNAYLLMGT